MPLLTCRSCDRPPDEKIFQDHAPDTTTKQPAAPVQATAVSRSNDGSGGGLHSHDFVLGPIARTPER